MYFLDIVFLMFRAMVYGVAMKYTSSFLLPERSYRQFTDAIIDFRKRIYTYLDEFWQSDQHVEDWFVVRMFLPALFFIYLRFYLKLITLKYFLGAFPILYWFFILLDFFLLLYIAPMLSDFILLKHIPSHEKFLFLLRFFIVIFYYAKFNVFMILMILFLPLSSIGSSLLSDKQSPLHGIIGKKTNPEYPIKTSGKL